MNELNREQISALMDDELEQNSAAAWTALHGHPEGRRIWERYHLIGECLRGNLPQFVDPRLADRISSSIVKEPAILATSGRIHQYFKPALGFAIAASVTVVAILGVRQAGIGPVTGSVPVIAEHHSSASAFTVAADTATPATPPEVASFQANAEAEARLNRYLVNYNEHRTNAGMQGMLPYVRIVAHEVVE